MSFEELISEGFEIENGRFYKRSGGITCYYVQKFGWGGNEYKIAGDYSANEYSIDTDAYGDWYLKRGYTEICRLVHLGGESWRKY